MRQLCYDLFEPFEFVRGGVVKNTAVGYEYHRPFRQLRIFVHRFFNRRGAYSFPLEFHEIKAFKLGGDKLRLDLFYLRIDYIGLFAVYKIYGS